MPGKDKSRLQLFSIPLFMDSIPARMDAFEANSKLQDKAGSYHLQSWRKGGVIINKLEGKGEFVDRSSSIVHVFSYNSFFRNISARVSYNYNSHLLVVALESGIIEKFMKLNLKSLRKQPSNWANKTRNTAREYRPRWYSILELGITTSRMAKTRICCLKHVVG